MALYNRYRPQDLDEIRGNDALVESLRVEDDELPHTILLSGPSGCGKTTIARILADMVSTPDDTRELNISNTRGIDMARQVIQMTRYRPLRSRARVVVLNECHKATNEFQNAMLEVLEEPPEHTYFILCTTEPAKLLKTVRSRCVEYKVERLSMQETISLLEEVCEGEEVEISGGVLRRIAQHSEGAPREALTLLEKIIGLEDEEQMLEVVKSGESIEDFDVPNVCRIILRGGNWKDVAGPLKTFNGDVENVRRGMLGYFSAVLLNPKGRPESRDIACFAITNLEKPFYDVGKPGLVAALYMILNPE